jgi:plasmid stabilization system protein ParE
LRLRYTPEAAAELDAVLNYIAERSPTGARRVKARIQEMINLALLHPYAGTRTRRRGLRRLVASPYPYLIFYEAASDEIIIHGIRHGARKPLPMSG